MTDKETALKLGERLFKINLVAERLKLELELSRDPLRRSTQQILNEVGDQILLPAYRERIEELDRRLSASTPGELLHTLQAYLEETLPSGHTPIQ